VQIFHADVIGDADCLGALIHYLQNELGMVGEINANANCVLFSGGWDYALRRVGFGEQST
jgi:hypothetical protein